MTINNTVLELKYFVDEDGVKYWDVDLDENKDISLISGVLSVSQTVKNAIYMWIAEYHFDLTIGIDWTEILGKPLNKNDLSSRLSTAVLSVSYVTRIVSIEYTPSDDFRSLAIKLTYLNTDNEEVTINANI